MQQSSRTDTVIVGAGIAGLSLAYALRRRGLTCRVFDAGMAGHGATWAAAGMLAPVHELEYQELELLHAGRKALLIYESWADALPDFGYDRCGSLEIALTPDDRPLLRRHFDFQRKEGLPARWIEGDELREVMPALAPSVCAGIHAPEDHQVDQRRLVEVLLQTLAASAGFSLHENEAVVNWRETRDGVEALTAFGAYPARRLILAAGVGHDAGWVAGMRVVPVRGQMVSVEPTDPPALTFPLRIRNRQYGNAYIVPKRDRWILGSTSEEMGYDKRPTAGGLLDVLNKSYAALPLLYDQPVLEVWSGLRPATASRRPVVDRLADAPVWVFNGLYRHGILLGPWLAEQLADWITEGRRPVDLEPFGFR